MSKGVPVTKDQIAEFRRLRAMGLGLIAMSKHVGISPGTIQMYVGDMKSPTGSWPRGKAAAKRDKEILARLAQEAEPKPEPITTTVATDISDAAIARGSLKERMLLELYKGKAEHIDELRDRLVNSLKPEERQTENIDVHNVAHVMRSLVRGGLANFRETGHGQAAVWRNIRLTNRGEERAFQIRRARRLEAQPVEPITKPVEEPKPNGVPTSAVNEDPAALEGLVPEKPRVETSGTIDASGKFPLIRILLGRELKHRSAVRLLREAGMGEQADFIEADAPKNTELEAEIVQLIKDKGIQLD